MSHRFAARKPHSKKTNTKQCPMHNAATLPKTAQLPPGKPEQQIGMLAHPFRCMLRTTTAVFFFEFDFTDRLQCRILTHLVGNLIGCCWCPASIIRIGTVAESIGYSDTSLGPGRHHRVQNQTIANPPGSGQQHARAAETNGCTATMQKGRCSFRKASH